MNLFHFSESPTLQHPSDFIDASFSVYSSPLFWTGVFTSLLYIYGLSLVMVLYSIQSTLLYYSVLYSICFHISCNSSDDPHLWWSFYLYRCPCFTHIEYYRESQNIERVNLCVQSCVVFKHICYSTYGVILIYFVDAVAIIFTCVITMEILVKCMTSYCGLHWVNQRKLPHCSKEFHSSWIMTGR